MEINVNAWLDKLKESHKTYDKNSLESNQEELARLYRYLCYFMPTEEQENETKVLRELMANCTEIHVKNMPKGCKDCPYKLEKSKHSPDDKYCYYCILHRQDTLGKLCFNPEEFENSKLDKCILRQKETDNG